ncbi:MAG: ribonuclease H family protein [Tissierellaceae bacterium]
MIKFYYAVRKGRRPGIYNSWAECEKEVKGFKEAQYKKFKSFEEALAFIEDEGNLIGGQGSNANEDIGLKDPNELKDNELIAYVDGSFSLATRTYSYGMVALTKEGKEVYSGKDDDEDLADMRNVAGELMGAVEAMRLALDKGKDTLYLHYDYQGIEAWARGTWKTNKPGTRAYKEFYDSIKDRLDVRFIKVLAHSGVEYNEEADSLAKKELS